MQHTNEHTFLPTIRHIRLVLAEIIRGVAFRKTSFLLEFSDSCAEVGLSQVSDFSLPTRRWTYLREESA